MKDGAYKLIRVLNIIPSVAPESGGPVEGLLSQLAVLHGSMTFDVAASPLRQGLPGADHGVGPGGR